MSSLPKVSIIIVHYGSLATTTRCLQSLQKMDSGFQVACVVIDNAAKEPAQKLEEKFPQTTVIRLKENAGFSGGNNAGIRYAIKQQSPDMIVLLNDDTTVAPNFLEALWERFTKRPHSGAIAPKIFFSPGKEFHQESYRREDHGNVLWYAGGWIDWKEVVAWHRGVDEKDLGQHDKATRSPFATGCCLALRPKALQKVGLLDDNLFLYWEDVELSLRLRKAGWEVWYEPQSQIWHDNAGSSGSGSQLHEYYQTRNRYLVGFRYAPARTKLFLLKQLFREYKTGSFPRKQAILDLIKRNYGKQPRFH